MDHLGGQSLRWTLLTWVSLTERVCRHQAVSAAICTN